MGVEAIEVIDAEGKMNALAGEVLAGLDRLRHARRPSTQLEELGALNKN